LEFKTIIIVFSNRKASSAIKHAINNRAANGIPNRTSNMACYIQKEFLCPMLTAASGAEPPRFLLPDRCRICAVIIAAKPQFVGALAYSSTKEHGFGNTKQEIFPKYSVNGLSAHRIALG
jgi:hypothetical protein